MKSAGKAVLQIMAFHPLIGVSGSVDLKETQHFLLSCYANALLTAGAVPLLIPPTLEGEALEDCLIRLDGLFLAGGNDLAPETYGCEPVEALGEVNPVRDRFELHAVRWAFEKKMPVFGICRGMQAMNVAMGGTLWQDLPSQYRTQTGEAPLAHSQKRRDIYPSHAVRIEPGTLLHSLAETESLRVNSMHHQAVRDAGRGLRVTAWAPDGVPEAVESPDHPFFLAVQWHPERYFDRAKEAMALFQAFAKAASAYAQTREMTKNHPAF